MTKSEIFALPTQETNRIIYATDVSRVFTIIKGTDGSAAIPTDSGAIIPNDSKWVVMTDWHFGEEFGRGGNQRCRDGYRRIGDHRPSLGVSCGDLMSPNAGADSPYNDYTLFRQIEPLSGCMWLHAMGNHEIGITGGTDEVKTTRQQVFYDGVRDFYTSNSHEFGQIPYTAGYTDTERNAYPGNAVYKAPPFDPQLYPQPGGAHQGGTVAVAAVELPEEEQARSLGYFAMRHYPTGVTHVVLNTAYVSGDFSTEQREWFEDEVIAKLNAFDRIVVYLHHGYGYMVGGAYTWLHGVLSGFAGKVLSVFSGHRHTNSIHTADGINYVTLDDGGSNKSKPYTDTNGTMAYALCHWNESTSTFHIEGYEGTTSRELVIA